MSPIKEKQIHQAFEIGVILKGLHAFLELAGGALLMFVSANTIVNIVASLTQEELIEDPNDLVAHYLFQSSQHLSVGGRAFAAWYLLSHGVIKLLLVVGLLKKKLWAYPGLARCPGILHSVPGVPFYADSLGLARPAVDFRS
jgi:uncharacterized membrane protein